MSNKKTNTSSKNKFQLKLEELWRDRVEILYILLYPFGLYCAYVMIDLSHYFFQKVLIVIFFIIYTFLLIERSRNRTNQKNNKNFISSKRNIEEANLYLPFRTYSNYDECVDISIKEKIKQDLSKVFVSEFEKAHTLFLEKNDINSIYTLVYFNDFIINHWESFKDKEVTLYGYAENLPYPSLAKNIFPLPMIVEDFSCEFDSETLYAKNFCITLHQNELKKPQDFQKTLPIAITLSDIPGKPNINIHRHIKIRGELAIKEPDYETPKRTLILKNCSIMHIKN